MASYRVRGECLLVFVALRCIASCHYAASAAGAPLPALAGTSSGASKKAVFDQWRRGFEAKDSASSENTEASSVQRILDHSKTAQEKAKQAQIASGYVGGGAGVSGSGSSGLEHSLLNKVHDRSSFEQDKLSSSAVQESSSSGKVDTGLVQGHDVTDVDIGGVFGGGGGGGASRGFSSKVLDQRRKQAAHSDSAQDSTYSDALQQTSRWDRGSLEAASRSAADIAQGGGYDSAGAYGLYGSAGDDSAKLVQKNSRGFEKLKQVASGFQRKRQADGSHNNRRVYKAATRGATLAGVHGSAGAFKGAELEAWDQGSVQHRDLDTADKVAFEKTRHVVDEEKAAAKDASVTIGRGLYGGDSSSGASAAASGAARNIEFDKTQGVKWNARSKSSTIHTFDTGVKQAAAGANTLIHPAIVYGHY